MAAVAAMAAPARGVLPLHPRRLGRAAVERALPRKARGPVHEGREELAAEGGVEVRLGLGEGGEQREARRVRQRLGQVPRVSGHGQDQGLGLGLGLRLGLEVG